LTLDKLYCDLIALCHVKHHSFIIIIIITY